MAWSTKQRQIAGMACRSAGIDDSRRKLILRQFRNAFFDRAGSPTDEPSSTSNRMNQADMERFMAIVEDMAGGQILHFTKNYWASKSGGRSDQANERQAWKIRDLYATYQAQDDGGRYNLDGLVYRFSGRRTSKLEELEPKEAWNLIEMLKALIEKRPSPAAIQKPAERQEKLFSNLDLPASQPASLQQRAAMIPPSPVCVGAPTDEEVPF